MKRILLLFLSLQLLILSGCNIGAKNPDSFTPYTISGTIYQEYTENPVEGMKMFFGNQNTISDSSGKFSITISENNPCDIWGYWKDAATDFMIIEMNGNQSDILGLGNPFSGDDLVMDLAISTDNSVSSDPDTITVSGIIYDNENNPMGNTDFFCYTQTFYPGTRTYWDTHWITTDVNGAYSMEEVYSSSETLFSVFLDNSVNYTGDSIQSFFLDTTNDITGHNIVEVDDSSKTDVSVGLKEGSNSSIKFSYNGYQDLELRRLADSHPTTEIIQSKVHIPDEVEAFLYVGYADLNTPEAGDYVSYSGKTAPGQFTADCRTGFPAPTLPTSTIDGNITYTDGTIAWSNTGLSTYSLYLLFLNVTDESRGSLGIFNPNSSSFTLPDEFIQDVINDNNNWNIGINGIISYQTGGWNISTRVNGSQAAKLNLIP